jgi:hypothetical protein
MTATHGDLFREIGELVVAAHAGATIDLTEKSEEMAARYAELGVPAETLARAIARSVGAVGISLAIVRPFDPPVRSRSDAADPWPGAGRRSRSPSRRGRRRG